MAICFGTRLARPNAQKSAIRCIRGGLFEEFFGDEAGREEEVGDGGGGGEVVFGEPSDRFQEVSGERNGVDEARNGFGGEIDGGDTL